MINLLWCYGISKYNLMYYFFREEQIMNASVAIQVLPTVTDEDEVIRIVDEVIDYINPQVWTIM